MSSARLKTAIDVARGKIPPDARRSDQWPHDREEHLKAHSTCAVCGGSKKLEVHHIRPFHLHPELELDPENFITLCEDDDNGVNCHLFFGHLGDFKSFNTDVKADAAAWQAKLSTRPKAEPAAPTLKEAP